MPFSANLSSSVNLRRVVSSNFSSDDNLSFFAKNTNLRKDSLKASLSSLDTFSDGTQGLV